MKDKVISSEHCCLPFPMNGSPLNFLSHMKTPDDVMLQVSRVVKSKCYKLDVKNSAYFRSIPILEGRQYRKGSSSSETIEQNPRDSQGRIMLCKACGFSEHFILQCPSKGEVIVALFEEFSEKSDIDDEVSLDHEEEDNVQNTSESINFINQITITDIANFSSHFKCCADMLKFDLERPGAPEKFMGICLDTGTTRSMIG
jgi:hypothetical protein